MRFISKSHHTWASHLLSLCPSQDHECFPSYSRKIVLPGPMQFSLCSLFGSPGTGHYTSLHFQCFHSHTLYFSLYLEFRFLICLLQLILQLSAKHGFLRDTLPTYHDLKYVPLLYPLVALQFSIVAPISIKPNYSFMQLYLMKGSMTVTKNRLWNQIKLKSWLITF